MQISTDRKVALFVSDIDNTVFDWVSYYVPAFEAMLGYVAETVGSTYEVLTSEASMVFLQHKSIEYPFLVQDLPTVLDYYGSNLDRLLTELVEPARQVFKKVGVPLLKPYEGVHAALAEIKKRHPNTPFVALTDAPRYVAMWKLNKLGLLPYFDAIYGLPDPRLPTDTQLGRVKVDPKILLKHLQQSNFGFTGRIRILPEEYEKPGTRGLKTVLMDFDIDQDDDAKQRTFWLGDNLRKDVALGQSVGVKSFWARFGTTFDPALLSRLNAFSPPENVAKNVALDPQDAKAPRPYAELSSFSDILAYL